MNAALDIITVVIIAAVVISNWRRGFFKSVMGFASLVIAYIVTSIYYSRVAQYIAEKYLYGMMQKNLLSDFGTILAAKTEGFDMSKLLADKPTEFMNILRSFGVTDQQVSQTLNSFTPPASIAGDIQKVNEAANRFVAEKIVNPVAYGISCFIAFVLLFIVCAVVLSIVVAIVDKVFKLPGLNFINKLLGFLLGIVMALVSCFIFAFAVDFALPYLQSAGLTGERTSAEVVEETLIFKQFYKSNPLKRMNIGEIYIPPLGEIGSTSDPAVTEPSITEYTPPETQS